MYALVAGCFGLAIGSYAVLENIRRGLMGGPGGLVEGFSLIAGLFCLGFGIALIIPTGGRRWALKCLKLSSKPKCAGISKIRRP